MEVSHNVNPVNVVSSIPFTKLALRTMAICPTHAKGSRSVANKDSKSDKRTTGSSIPRWSSSELGMEIEGPLAGPKSRE